MTRTLDGTSTAASQSRSKACSSRLRRAWTSRRADLVPGDSLAATLDAMFADPAVVHVDRHNAGPGCFAARAVRA